MNLFIKLAKNLLLWIKPGKRICSYSLTTSFLDTFLYEMYARMSVVAIHFLPNYNTQEGTDKFIYTLLQY